ncbi:hypothetical protein TcCL_NonESM03422, partial [Trypanosoma cruzi]
YHKHKSYSASTRGFAPSRRAEVLLGTRPLHPKEKPRQLFRAAQITHIFSARSISLRLPAEPDVGVDTELSLSAVHVGRFSRFPVDTHSVSCGGGPVRNSAYFAVVPFKTVRSALNRMRRPTPRGHTECTVPSIELMPRPYPLKMLLLVMGLRAQ